MKTVVTESVKLVVGTTASVGTGRIIRYAVDKIVPTTLGKSEKILVVVGTLAIAGTVGAAVAKSVGEILDETVQTVDTIVTTIKNSHKETDLQESLA